MSEPIPAPTAVLFEQSGLYVFTRHLFETTGRRIGSHAYIHPVGTVKGHDIDTEEELELAEVLAAQLDR